MIRKSKYNSRRTVVDGITFHSKGEAMRYQELKLMEKAGEIIDLRLQVPYLLAPSAVINGRKRPALRYFADFVYSILQYGSAVTDNWITVVEDSKGQITEGYRIKRHLMKAIHNIDILETGGRKK